MKDGRVANFQAVASDEPLTEREAEILRRLARGMSNREIANDLSLALETIKWYNKRIYEKLGVDNRTQAARAADLQVAAEEESPATPPQESDLPRNNLPAQVTSFVGRQREIVEAKRLLAEARLLSIIGPAGCGKTRVALQLASEMLLHFPDGVFFVPLASLTADKVLGTVAERLQFQFHSGDRPLQQLLSYFQGKRLLLVLDNFEHVLESAGLVTDILRATPGIKVLVTSRERLKLYGEATYWLGGLTLPDQSTLDRALRSEALELFVQRAKAVAPHLVLDEETVRQCARICRLVEGLPLGIELAATWVDVISPLEIAQEIEQSLDILESEFRGMPSGHNSMRAAIDRSWNMLNPDQQVAFRRLSTFRGGFTRAAAHAVTGVDLRTLQALVNKSLLQYDRKTGRYQIHELLNHYAQEKLAASGESPQICEAHAVYFSDFMAERWPHMKGHRQKEVLLEIEADIENTRAAWHYWIRAGNVAALKKFFHSFWVIHDIRGWYPSGIDLFKEGITAMRGQAGDEARAGLGWLLAAQGLYSLAGGDGARQGFALAQEGVSILSKFQRPEEMLIPCISLFIAAIRTNKGNVASRAAADCYEIANTIGDPWGIAKAKQLLTVHAIEEHDYATAEHLGHEALAFFEESGDNWSVSVLCIEVLALLAITKRQFDRARTYIERGVKAASAIDFEYSLQMAYWQLGYIEALQENYAKSGEYWSKALGIGERIVGGNSTIGFGGSSSHVEWGGRKLIDEEDMGLP